MEGGCYSLYYGGDQEALTNDEWTVCILEETYDVLNFLVGISMEWFVMVSLYVILART